jgi:hypothetical protein
MRGDVIGVFGDRSLRQHLDRIGFFDEGSAHGEQIVTPALKFQRNLLRYFLSRTGTRLKRVAIKIHERVINRGKLPFNRKVTTAALGTVLTMTLFWNRVDAPLAARDVPISDGLG